MEPEPEVLHSIDSFITVESGTRRNAVVFKHGECVSIKHLDDNLPDDFFELNLDDIKFLHKENVKRAKEAEEGAQVN